MHCNNCGKVPPLNHNRIFIMFMYIYSTHVMSLCTRFDICSSGKVNSDGGTHTKLHVLAN